MQGSLWIAHLPGTRRMMRESRDHRFQVGTLGDEPWVGKGVLTVGDIEERYSSSLEACCRICWMFWGVCWVVCQLRIILGGLVRRYVQILFVIQLFW